VKSQLRIAGFGGLTGIIGSRERRSNGVGLPLSPLG
jgi:hypothetical protein